MKKKGLVTGAVAMALAVSMAFMPATAKAETVDNVDVTVTTDKTEYSSGEEVKLNVNVKNNNSYELKSPNITFQLPDGLTVDGKSTYSYDFNSISSGATTDEVVELKNVTVTDNNSQITNPTQDSNSNVIASTENNSDDKQAETKAPQTGDTTKTIIYVITLLLAVSGIIFIVLKKKKIASSLLVLALIATGLAVIPSSSVKAAINKSVTGKVTVKVDAKDADINYAFTYSVDTVSDDNGSTDTTQPSGGSSTEVTNRSEIGKKILEHKNSEEVESRQDIFGCLGLKREHITESNGKDYSYDIREVSLSKEDSNSFGNIEFSGNLKGQYVFYDSKNDILYYIKGIKLAPDDPVSPCTFSLTKDYISYNDFMSIPFSSKAVAPAFVLDFFDGNTSIDGTFSDFIQNAYIGMLDENADIIFSCKYTDFPKYAKLLAIDYNATHCDFISVEPIYDSNGSVHKVKATFSYEIKGKGTDFETGKIRGDLLTISAGRGLSTIASAKVDTSNNDTVVMEFEPNVGNGMYYYKFTYQGGTLGGSSIDGTFAVNCLKDTTSEPIPAEKLEPATVTISGTPADNVSFGTPVTMKMTTDKPCTMSFNGQPVSSDYATSGDFTVTANGTYSYVAVTEQGVPTTGTFTVDFFTGSAFNTRNDWKDPANSPLLP